MDEGLAASLGATVANGLPWDRLRGQKLWTPPVEPMPTAPVDPNAGLGTLLTRSSVLPPQPPAGTVQLNAPTGDELRASPPPAPSERVTQGLSSAFTAAGADNYTANNLASRLMSLVQATPLSVPLGAMDTMHAKSQGDDASVALGMAGMIPGAKAPAKAAANIAAPAIRRLGTAADDFAQGLRYFHAGEMPVGEASAGKQGIINPYVQTVDNPYRMMYPGIYRDPREIARIANERVIPEDPALRQLWGVSRGDLESMHQGRGVGTEIPDISGLALKPKGATSAVNIMNPRNEERLLNTLHEAGLYPGLRHADAWYVMDPMYHRLEQMFGPQEAVKRYRELNNMMGMASPGSDVLTEIQRGSAAHWLNRQGRWDDFRDLGGVAADKRGGNYPSDMQYIMGHPYHSTAQSGPMEKYLGRGYLQSDAPKVPAYALASGVPQTGFQTRYAVGDAHYSRGVGLADTRKGPTDVQASWSPSEYQTLTPWWRNKIAQPLGIEAVPAQARLWTVLGPQTGVDSPLGQGKLELLSQQIMVAARRLGISPEQARDKFLRGEAGAGVLAGTAGLGSALGASMMSRGALPEQQDQRS